MSLKALLVCTAALCAACAACNSPSPRLNAPPHGVPEATSDLQGTYVYMIDNALLEDMAISDIDFVPHRPMLNALGEQRLSRLASLMEAYGGEIRYSTDLKNRDLVKQRTDAIKNYLCDAGIDTSAEVVRIDLPGGSGLEASEVILIKVNEGTYRPSKAAGGTAPEPKGMGQGQQ